MRNEKQPAVYIVASGKNGTLYIGLTSALWQRICDHKNGHFYGFTKKYGVSRLVWYEHHHSMPSAIHREKRLKTWLRSWKIELIEKFNPEWRDLHDEIDAVATLVDEYQPRG